MNLQNVTYGEWYINQKRIPDKDSNEYEPFFEFHKELCLNGFMMDGVYINPFLYWHLNMWRTEVDVVDNNGRIYQKYTNPTLRDNEWIITNEIERAQKERKGLVILGIRRLGKSVLEASYIGWGATFDENSQNVIAGLNAPDIKLITDKLDKGLNFLPEYFRWQRVEDNWKNQVTLGIKTKSGERIPFSQILIRNLDEGNNEEAIAGTKPRKLIIDEIGKGSYLRGLQAAIPGFTTPFGWGCSPILTGTGGDMKRFMDAKSLMFDVDNYNFLSYNNDDDTRRVHGLFISNKFRMEAKYPSTLGAYLEAPTNSDLYNVTIHVSDEEKAEAIVTENLERLKKAGDRSAYLKEKMYYPQKVDDIFLNEDTNIFDIEAARRQKTRLLQNERTGTPVVLHIDEGRVYHEFTDKQPITNFPLKPTDNKDAPIVIYEFPIENPPYGLYVAGCLLPGEKVITEKGLKNVEDVSLTDRLINKDGEKVEIVNLQRYLKKDETIYTFKISNVQRTTSFTKEHPIYVSDPIGNKGEPIIEKRFQFDFANAEDVKVGQWIKYPNIYKKPNDFDIDILWNSSRYRIDRIFNSPLKNPDFWWFIGIILGDGWCNVKNGKISASFNIEETLHIDRYEKIINKLFNRSVFRRIRSKCVEMTFTCQELNRFLITHFGDKAYGKHLPDWVKRISVELKYQLILGYLDSDGCVLYDKKRNYYNLDFVSINLELLEDIQDVLFSLGYVSGINVLRNEKTEFISNKQKLSIIKKTYQLRMGHNDTVKFRKSFAKFESHKLLKVNLDTLTSTVKSPKKGAFMSECGNYIYFKIKSISTSIYSGWVYNFECDTHTYLCKNITTHNCDPYRQGQAKYSTSLGSVYIYKRMHDITGEKYQDMFVASYCARPDKKEHWEEQARLLIKYYNARTLCENDEMSFIEYMKSKGDSYYLEKQPNWLKEVIPNTTVNREFGIHRSAQKIINYLHSCLKAYMEEPIHVEKDEDGRVIKEILGVSKIFDPMLLEEIIQYNEEGNFDRIVAAELAIAQAMKMDPIFGKAGGTSDDRVKSLYSKKSKQQRLFSSSGNMFNTRKNKLFN